MTDGLEMPHPGRQRSEHVRTPNSMSRGSGLRLGIDLDGVVADFSSGWMARYNQQFGTKLSHDDVVEWDAPVSLTHFENMDEFWGWFATAGHQGRSLFAELDPYEGALDALHRFHNAGHQIIILTTKPDFAVSDTYRWLSEQRIPTREVHLIDAKAEVDCDVYLDDADHNLRALASRRNQSVVCRFVRSWNSPQLGTVDARSWAEFGSLVEQTARALPVLGTHRGPSSSTC